MNEDCGQGQILGLCLKLAVPLWSEVVKEWTSERRISEARRAGEILAEQGDRLLFRCKARADTEHPVYRYSSGELFNITACAVACALAESPGEEERINKFLWDLVE